MAGEAHAATVEPTAGPVKSVGEDSPSAAPVGRRGRGLFLRRWEPVPIFRRSSLVRRSKPSPGCEVLGLR